MEKNITKATPFVDANGNVIKWEIELTYLKNKYEVKFNATAEIDALKKSYEFLLAELWDLANESHWDAVFNSMYESTHSDTPSSEQKIDGFDVGSLL